MLKLTDNQEVLFRDVNIGKVYDLNYSEGSFIINTDEGIVCIPREDATQDELEVFTLYEELHQNDPPPVVDNTPPPKTELQILQETVDALVIASLGG